jgi:3-oxoacyl-[acyl-carrier-protein] synthase II
MKRVVITGMGALTPLGLNLNDYWTALRKGTSGAAPITKYNTEKFKTKFACELKGFDVLNHMDRNEAKKYDPFSQYAIVAVGEALTHARVNLETADRTQIGVIWGTGQGGFQTFEDQVSEFVRGDGTPRFNPYYIPRTIPNMASGVVSIKYGLQGMNFTVITACASSNSAMVDALNYIRWGKIKMVVTGGSEAAITGAAMGGFSVMRALSTRNDDPASASRPWDVNRDGFVMGEGAGALIFEEYEHAKARGASILCEVVGGAMTADAYHLSATHPEGDGAFRAMKLALEDANLTPADVDYINAHATSTPVGDGSELIAIQNLFGEHTAKLHISGTKSQTGHLLGAAGAVEGIASVMAIREGMIPPTINTTEIDPALPSGLNIVTGQPLAKTVNVAMSNTFGFGGHNGIVVFRTFDE